MAVSELPGNPNAVWTVKRNIAGAVLCYNRNQKLVLLSVNCREV